MELRKIDVIEIGGSRYRVTAVKQIAHGELYLDPCCYDEDGNQFAAVRQHIANVGARVPAERNMHIYGPYLKLQLENDK